MRQELYFRKDYILKDDRAQRYSFLQQDSPYDVVAWQKDVFRSTTFSSMHFWSIRSYVSLTTATLREGGDGSVLRS